jgi:hypothetical protein
MFLEQQRRKILKCILTHRRIGNLDWYRRCNEIYSDIETTYGMAASMGSILLSSGTKGKKSTLISQK